MGRVIPSSRRRRPVAGVTSALAALSLLAACDRMPSTPATPGARLEAAALAAGIVVDPATAPITGSWARDNQRLCVVPAANGTTRVGAVLDYGDGQGCVAAGTLDRRGDRLRIGFGDCRFEAGFDGERIAFPAELPEACRALCTGRASLDAMTVDRVSTSVSEASTLRTPAGRPLCAG